MSFEKRGSKRARGKKRRVKIPKKMSKHKLLAEKLLNHDDDRRMQAQGTKRHKYRSQRRRAPARKHKHASSSSKRKRTSRNRPSSENLKISEKHVGWEETDHKKAMPTNKHIPLSIPSKIGYTQLPEYHQDFPRTTWEPRSTPPSTSGSLSKVSSKRPRHDQDTSGTGPQPTQKRETRDPAKNEKEKKEKPEESTWQRVKGFFSDNSTLLAGSAAVAGGLMIAGCPTHQPRRRRETSFQKYWKPLVALAGTAIAGGAATAAICNAKKSLVQDSSSSEPYQKNRLKSRPKLTKPKKATSGNSDVLVITIMVILGLAVMGAMGFWVYSESLAADEA